MWRLLWSWSPAGPWCTHGDAQLIPRVWELMLIAYCSSAWKPTLWEATTQITWLIDSMVLEWEDQLWEEIGENISRRLLLPKTYHMSPTDKRFHFKANILHQESIIQGVRAYWRSSLFMNSCLSRVSYHSSHENISISTVFSSYLTLVYWSY